ASARREEAENRLVKLREELDDVADRLARVDDDPADGEPSTEERDHAAGALAQARAMETEARLALRTAEERSGGVRGKAERLRRQATSERQARARHEAAQLRRERSRALAATVAELSADVAEQVSVSLERAAADRGELDAARTAIAAELNKARADASAAAKRVAELTDGAHRGD